MRYVARMLREGFSGFDSMSAGELARWLLSKVFLVLGGVFVVLGVLELATPLPFGIPLILLGVTIVLNTSPQAKKSFVIWGQRYPRTVGRVRDWIRSRRRASHRRKQDGGRE